VRSLAVRAEPPLPWAKTEVAAKVGISVRRSIEIEIIFFM
jgi:hypothetical protein